MGKGVSSPGEVDMGVSLTEGPAAVEDVKDVDIAGS